MADKIDDGGPAFPTLGDKFITDAQGRTGPASLWGMQGDGGMTLRDWFAGQALAGMMSRPLIGDLGPAGIADLALAFADAMLAARQKGGAS